MIHCFTPATPVTPSTPSTPNYVTDSAPDTPKTVKLSFIHNKRKFDEINLVDNYFSNQSIINDTI